MRQPLKSGGDTRPEASERPGVEVFRLIASILTFASIAGAQPLPASISTIKQPGFGSAVFDSAGNAYYLSGAATAGAAQTQPGGGTCFVATGIIGSIPAPCSDASVIKVDASGKQVWGTFLGGPTADLGTALAIDANGNVVVTGSTAGQFPTTAGAAIASSTTAKVFAAKISADGSRFLYSTYLPASVASASSIAVDSAGNAYIAGKTGTGHAVVLKLSADGSTIAYTVSLGGSGEDAATVVTVDALGNVFVGGQTASADFPTTPGAMQQQLNGPQNAFLTRLDPAGKISSSTYLGGSGTDSASSIVIDTAGNIDLAGSTSSLDFPTTQGTMQASAIVPAWNNYSPAGFVAQFGPDGTSLHWASYVMSSDFPGYPGVPFQMGVGAIATNSAGDIYLSGLTGPGFPVTPSAPQICFQGTRNRLNGFLAHLNSRGELLDASYLGDSAGGDIYFAGGLLPLASGTVLVSWRTSGNVVSKVQFGSGGWTAPACLSTSVLNAATQSGTGGIAPGELVTLTGYGIGPDTGTAYEPDAQGKVPTELAGVQVLFDGVPAPVLYAQSRQINAIAPAAFAAQTTHVTTTYNNQQFGAAIADVTFGSPGIFRLQIGRSAQAVALNQDGTANGPSNPAARGSVVTVWGTGYGQTNPACVPGGLNVPTAVPLRAGITALIVGGIVQMPQAALGVFEEAQHAGSAPGLVCGVVQVDFQVPESIAPGAFFFLPWIRFVDGNTTTEYQPPLGAMIAVK